MTVAGRPRSIDEHRRVALSLVAPLPAVRVRLDDAHGHVLAEPVLAPSALPRWDSSAMDGYAVRAADLVDAAPARPVALRVLADLPAGTDAEPRVVAGASARIMTGAPMPPGADAVVPVERTDRSAGDPRRVLVTAPPRPGEYVRRVGEDAAAGDLVLAAGTLLGPAQVGAAAALGRAELEVHRRPRVAVLSTGSELVPPGTPLRRGQVPDSNATLLAAMVRAAGGEPVRLAAVPDDATALRDALDGVAGSVDAVLTSGGVSLGAYDVVKEVLGAEPGVDFVQVPMQPGKPQGLGRLRSGTPVFALPGNPVSSFVSFEVFVRPALLRLRGLVDVARPVRTCVVLDGWRTPPGRAQYMPVVVVPAGDDVPGVRPAVAGGSASHLVAGLARVQGLAFVEARVERVEAGDRVPVMRVDR